MKNFIKRNSGKLILAIVFTIIGAFIIKAVSKPTQFIAYDKVVNSVVIDDDTVYLKFLNDAKTYIAYENNGVDLNLLKQLQYGDQVNVTLKNTDFNSTYTIIYVLKDSNKVLLDVTEYYRQNDIVTGTIFVSLPFAISLSLILLSIFINKKPVNTVEKFENRMGGWVLALFVIGLTIGITFSVDFITLSILKLVPPHNYGFISIGFLFAIVPALGIVTYKRSSFSLTDGVYKHVDLWKTKTVNIKDISFVYRTKISYITKFYFIGKDDSILWKFIYEPILIGRNNLLLDSLENNNLEIEDIYVEMKKKRYSITYPIDEDKQIKALILFKKKDYVNAYDLYDDFIKVANVNYFKYQLMISSLYRDEYDKACKLYKELIDSSAFVYDKSLSLDIKTIKYNFALSLVETKHNEEAYKIFDELKIKH